MERQEENGHCFSPERGTCIKCGITWRAYAENGRLECPGEKLDLPRPFPFEED